MHRQPLLTHGREDEDTGRWAGGPSGRTRSGRCAEAYSGSFGGGAGGECLRCGMVLGEDRRGLGGQQAGCAQEARQEDPAEVPWSTTEEKGKEPVIFTRFSDRSRMCVEAALDEARMLGHDSLGDEDLLLGILRADDGIGAEALSSLGVTLEGARE